MISNNRGEDLQGIVQRMTASLARRGPDDEGFASWPGVVLGHRRLAILDLSPAGHQPMLSDDGSVGLVFNGCIYNFQALREELIKKGHRFRSQCDTEVLLRGYQEWGIDALVPKLRGMFAFGLWDQNKRGFWLVRDRLGVKPLYVSEGNGGLAFASTHAALADAGLAGDLDPQAVLEFLHWGFVSDGRCIRQGVRKVQAGTILEYANGEVKERPYWTLPAVNPESRIRFEDAVDRTEELFVEAVRLRLISDVPVGALLSAGIDSSLVCWAMAKLNANISAFTVSTPGDAADESADAKRTADSLGIPHKIVSLRQEQQPDLDALIAAFGEPFAASSALGMLQVSQAIKPFATVLLTGDGGDDVFLGYPFHKSFWMAQRAAQWMPSWATSAWKPVHRGHGTSADRAKHFLDFATGGIGAVARIQNALPFLEERAMLGPKFDGLALPEREMAMSVAAGRRLLPDILQREQRTRFVGEFMTKVDGATMYHSLEARAPFLDHHLWDFAAQLPYEVRLHGGQLKPILREIVRRRIGPEAAFRKKQGFTIPVERWLASRWRKQLEELGRNSVLEEEGWIRRGTLRPAVDSAVQSGYASVALWHLVVFDHWCKRSN